MPVDSSIASAVALKTAVDLSTRDGAHLTLVHALRDVPRELVFGAGEAGELIRRLPERMTAIADALRRKAATAGAKHIETNVVTGLAHGAILDAADRNEADLIVMGVARRSWVDRMAFGSTLRRVLRRASVPVVVVPVTAGTQPWGALEETGPGAWAGTTVARRAA